MNVDAYLRRIKHKGELIASLSTLQELQEAHLYQIPFENLDIHYHIPIVLDVDRIFQKVMHNHRGGFCYELNSLFAKLLQQLGFTTQLISARVFNSKKNTLGEEFDHMAILVQLERHTYLVDVGFGEFTLHPLLLKLDVHQIDARGIFTIQRYDEQYLGVFKEIDSVFTLQYIFKTHPRQLKEFEGMARYHQTNPNSHFTHNKLISRPTTDGRITLTDTALKITKPNYPAKNVSIENKDFKYHLKKWFSIDALKITPENE